MVTRGEADSPPVVSGVLVERRVYRVFLGHAGRDARFLRQRFFNLEGGSTGGKIKATFRTQKRTHRR